MQRLSVPEGGAAVETRPHVLPWLALVAVYLLWGSTYLAIRIAVASIPPLLMAGARFMLAGAILYPVAVRRSGQRPSARQLGGAAVVGVVLLAMGNGAVTWAEQFVESGLAALLVATVPMWMVVFDWLGPAASRPGGRVIGGLGVGLVGVWWIAQPDGSAAGSLWPIVVVLLGSLAWAFGSVRSRTVGQPHDPLVATGIQMIAGGAALLLVAVVSGELGRLQLQTVTPSSVAAYGWLVVGGSLLGFTSYVYALRTLPTATVATYAFVNPVVAVALGWVVLGERLSPTTVIGGGLVVGAVALIVSRRRALPAVPAAAQGGRQ